MTMLPITLREKKLREAQHVYEIEEWEEDAEFARGLGAFWESVNGRQGAVIFLTLTSEFEPADPSVGIMAGGHIVYADQAYFVPEAFPWVHGKLLPVELAREDEERVEEEVAQKLDEDADYAACESRIWDAEDRRDGIA